jgi:hypothetical protein
MIRTLILVIKVGMSNLSIAFAQCLFVFFTTESSILAQNERWRRGSGMQVERECDLRIASTVANG